MTIHEVPEFRGAVEVFRDRTHAGEVLAGLLEPLRGEDVIVLAIPAGGIAVGAAVARRLAVPLDVAVVSKITFPHDTEAGYGAVAFDGTVRIDECLVARAGLGSKAVARGIEATRRKVARRVETLRGRRPFPALVGKTAIVVDDGIASGLTMRVALEAARAAGADRAVAAAPTGHASSLERLAAAASAVFCPNIRGGYSFAVADAYECWSDVAEAEAERILREQSDRPPAGPSCG